jgi:citrate lyase subunit beta/citryl-CoA lyase
VATAERPRLIVRVNSLTSRLIDDDLEAIVGARPDAILLPKAEGAASVVHFDAKLITREAINGVDEGHIKIIAIATETAASLFLAGTYRGASPRLIGLTWGAEDLSVELGAESNRDAAGKFLDPYRLARTLCLAGASAAQVQPIDTVYVDFRNDAGLKRECEEARREGFTGKMAIHPAQVAIINGVFTPSAEAVARAKAVIAAFADQPDAGVIGIDGVMYDRPHLARAQQLLARAKA